MAATICSNCGTEIKEGNIFCEKCGKSTVEKETELVQESSIIKTKSNKALIAVVDILCVIFLVIGALFFYKSYDVKNNYYNSENYSSLNKNSYVGGDAYNFIINGTYFTAYAVIGSTSTLCSVICLCTTFIISSKKK